MQSHRTRIMNVIQLCRPLLLSEAAEWLSHSRKPSSAMRRKIDLCNSPTTPSILIQDCSDPSLNSHLRSTAMNQLSTSSSTAARLEGLAAKKIFEERDELLAKIISIYRQG
jgi:hypothetical protein